MAAADMLSAALLPRAPLASTLNLAIVGAGIGGLVSRVYPSSNGVCETVDGSDAMPGRGVSSWRVRTAMVEATSLAGPERAGEVGSRRRSRPKAALHSTHAPPERAQS